jgi:hypothetical protein
MAETNFGSSGQATEQRGHHSVTGSATLQPGTFHEPDQPRPSSSGDSPLSNLTNKAEEWASTAGTALQETWSSTLSCMSRHPLAVFATGIGLGYMIARARSV